jgi:hypothetical protein
MIKHIVPRFAAFSFALALGTGGLAVLSPATAAAAPLSCPVVETTLTAGNTIVLAALNQRIGGSEYRLNRRKTLVIHGVRELSVSGGCELTAVVDVTLERKWRRDAEGTVTVRAHVDVDAATSGVVQLAFSDVRVIDVSLSHTLGIGESIYAWVANKVLPDSETVTVDLTP